MFTHLNHSKQAVNYSALHNSVSGMTQHSKSYETTGTDTMYFPKYTMLILIYNLRSPICIVYELPMIFFFYIANEYYCGI